MQCDICGVEGATMREVTRNFGTPPDTCLIEGVPMVSCPNCGERYMTAETLQEVERIKEHWDEVSENKTLSVARFEGAASH